MFELMNADGPGATRDPGAVGPRGTGYTMAIGRPGEPVAPLIRSGANTYTNS